MKLRRTVVSIAVPSDRELQKRLGVAIARARTARGWSQPQLAEALGLSLSYIGTVERGERAVSLHVLAAVAHVLGIKLDEVLAGNGAERRAVDELATLTASVPPELRGVAKDVLRALARRAKPKRR